jgi:hypothetical protein
MCHSPCSWVATPSPNPTRVMVWLEQTSIGYNPYVRSFNGCCMEG